MKRPMQLRARLSRMRGLSLIEIMIALGIGAVLVLGLVEVFAASRTAYQLSAGLARVQENGRFALDFLQRDLRMAGHLGCVNDQARFLPENMTGTRLALASTFNDPLTPGDFASANHAALRFDAGMRGYEATGTDGATALAVTTVPVLATAADAWTPVIDAQIFSSMVRPVAGSDVVALRFFSASGAQMLDFDPAGTPVTVSVAPAQTAVLSEGVANPGLFGVSDCMNAAVFQATDFNTTTGVISVRATDLNQDTLTGNEAFVAGQANVFRAESVVFYVGVNPAGNPALYRLRFTAAPGAAALTAVNEELVEGVESLQLRYGQDNETNPANRPTGNIGASRVASGLLPAGDADNAWRRVGAVQVGLLMRSSERASATQRDTTQAEVRPLSVLGVRIDPPSDTYYRSVYEDNIALRNRLFGN